MANQTSLRAFIVHGHDHDFRDTVKNHFVTNLGFEEAVVLDEIWSSVSEKQQSQPSTVGRKAALMI